MELKRNGIYTYKGNVVNENCKRIILSEEAHKKIVAETFSYGDDETGGVLIGYIYQGQWYVTDVIDAGIKANHTKTFFTYDENYVNHQLKKKSEIYKYPQATLGFYHRHPSSLDTFSLTDEKTMKIHCDMAAHGLISMLVNIDPDFRMTFYYVGKDDALYNVDYEISDEKIPAEFLELATFDELAERYDVELSHLKESKYYEKIAEMDANRYAVKEKVLVSEDVLNDREYEGPLYGFKVDTGVWTVVNAGEKSKVPKGKRIGYMVKSGREIRKKIAKTAESLLFLKNKEALVYDVNIKKLKKMDIEVYSFVQDLCSRNSGLLESEWMKDSTVVISGCGSVGSLVAVQLARSGIGNMVLCDPDCLEIHNICRHQLDISAIGRRKVDAVAEKIKLINPDINIKVFPKKFQDVPIGDYCDLIKSKDKTLFVGTCDNRAGNALVCQMADELGVAFAALGFLSRATVAEIYTMIPGELTYGTVFKTQIQKGIFHEWGNLHYMDEEDIGKVTFVPGLDVDIEYGTSFFSKILLDMINRTNKEEYTARVFDSLTQYTLLAGTSDIQDAFYKKNLEPFVPMSVEMDEEFYEVEQNC